jgi:hypothetical protein
MAGTVKQTATQSFTLTVRQPPAIASLSPITVTAGTPMSPITITATGFPAPTISRTGAMPGGLTLTRTSSGSTSTATISGTPSATSGGVYTETITASNAAGTTTQTLALTVNAAPVLTANASTSVTVGIPMTALTVRASGYPVPSITASGLPNGLSLVDNHNGTASLSGTPSGAGNVYPVTFSATNPLGTTTKAFTLTVRQVPTITSPASLSLKVGAAVSPTFMVVTTGYPVPRVSRTGTLPRGLTFTNNGNGTATIHGTPVAGTAGTYSLLLTATNAAGAATQTLTITVT